MLAIRYYARSAGGAPTQVRAGMKMFGDITSRGKAALEAGNINAVADLMDENFALRY